MMGRFRFIRPEAISIQRNDHGSKSRELVAENAGIVRQETQDTRAKKEDEEARTN